MNREKICLIVGVLNEASALPKFFKAHTWCDEIIILDSGSSDKSEKITCDYNRNFLHKPLRGSHNQRHAWAIQQTDCEWIFLIDPDEFIIDELKDEIFEILENGTDHAGFKNCRINFFMGEPLRHGGWSGDGLKMFRREKTIFEGDSYHESPIIDGTIGQLNGEVWHYPSPNIHWNLQKFNYISEFDLNSYYEQYGVMSHKKFCWMVFYKPFRKWWKSFVWKKGYKDGLHGMIYSAMIFAFDMIRICKYGERYLVKNSNIPSLAELPDPWECRKH